MLQINELVFSNINDALMTIEAVIFLTIVQLRYFIDNNKCFNTKTNPILLSTNPYVVEIQVFQFQNENVNLTDNHVSRNEGKFKCHV